jgi:outer membrane receptor protein involved in Fe transport
MDPRRARLAASSVLGAAIAAILYGGMRNASADTPEDRLEEVIVTARNRAEKLQDVPQNIDVFRSEDIQNLGIAQLEDYLTLSPSISFISTGPGQQRIFMRGVSDGSNPNYGHSNLSTTDYLVDDLSFNYYGHIPDLHLYDVERIEVLNGPQGTSFGPGALSGAVRIVTKKPDPSAFSAGADFDGGQIDGGANNWTYEGYVNLPLVEGKTALRISAYSVQDGGYIDNLLGTRHWLNGTVSTDGAWAGNNYNTRDVIGTRIGLQQNLPHDWSLTVTGFYQRQLYRGSWEEDPTRFGPLNLERFAPQGGYDYNRFLDLHAEGDVGIGDLVYAGGYTAQRKRRLYDYSEYAQYTSYGLYAQASACSTGIAPAAHYGGCNVPYMYAVTDGLIQQWSNELRLQSKAGGRAHWTVGAYWEKIYDPYSGHIQLPGVKLGGEEAQYLIAAYHNLATPSPEEWYSDYGDDHYRQVTEFGDLTFDLDPHWSVEGGIQHYHSSVSETDTAGYYYTQNVPILRSDASNRTNFKAGVNFKPTGRELLYFSFAQGYRDGGFNYISQYDNPAYPRYFKPDHLDNYELGNKSEFLGGRLVWNSALYYMRWTDYQVSVNVPQAPFSLHANAGDARIYGLESSVEVRPVEGLTLSFDGNYNDARITSDEYQSTVYTVIPGERLPEAPYFNYNATARYERPINPQLRAYTQFDLAHKGDMWNDLREDTRALQPAYTICNVRAGLGKPVGGWTAEAYVTNVSNRRAVIFANYTGYSHTDIPNEPRVFGLRLSYRWGKT